MIIVDYSGIMYSSVTAQIGYDPEIGAAIDEGLIRHTILNTIRYNNREFRQKFGELVLVFDSSTYWRKSVFPNYKIRRKKARDESMIDWELVFSTTKKVKGEIIDHFPYRTFEVGEAEADDVIAELVRIHHNEQILIISTDQDLIQLQDELGDRITQYDPVRKRYLTHPSPSTFLLEKIIKGDAGDDVPNVMMPDDTFIQGIRQKPITAKRLEEFGRDLPNGIGTEEHLQNFKRNDLLINLNRIPEDIRRGVRKIYAQPNTKTKKHLTNYFVKNRLKNLYEGIADF